MVKLSEAQTRALVYIAIHPECSASMIGQAIMDGRETRTRRSQQGYGRIGGVTGSRLVKKALVSNWSRSAGTHYRITVAGRAALTRVNPV